MILNRRRQAVESECGGSRWRREWRVRECRWRCSVRVSVIQAQVV